MRLKTLFFLLISFIFVLHGHEAAVDRQNSKRQQQQDHQLDLYTAKKGMAAQNANSNSVENLNSNQTAKDFEEIFASSPVKLGKLSKQQKKELKQQRRAEEKKAKVNRRDLKTLPFNKVLPPKMKEAKVYDQYGNQKQIVQQLLHKLDERKVVDGKKNNDDEDEKMEKDSSDVPPQNFSDEKFDSVKIENLPAIPMNLGSAEINQGIKSEEKMENLPEIHQDLGDGKSDDNDGTGKTPNLPDISMNLDNEPESEEMPENPTEMRHNFGSDKADEKNLVKNEAVTGGSRSAEMPDNADKIAQKIDNLRKTKSLDNQIFKMPSSKFDFNRIEDIPINLGDEKAEEESMSEEMPENDSEMPVNLGTEKTDENGISKSEAAIGRAKSDEMFENANKFLQNMDKIRKTKSLNSEFKMPSSKLDSNRIDLPDISMNLGDEKIDERSMSEELPENHSNMPGNLGFEKSDANGIPESEAAIGQAKSDEMPENAYDFARKMDKIRKTKSLNSEFKMPSSEIIQNLRDGKPDQKADSGKMAIFPDLSMNLDAEKTDERSMSEELPENPSEMPHNLGGEKADKKDVLESEATIGQAKSAEIPENAYDFAQKMDKIRKTKSLNSEFKMPSPKFDLNSFDDESSKGFIMGLPIHAGNSPIENEPRSINLGEDALDELKSQEQDQTEEGVMKMPKEEADQTEEEMPKVSTNEVYLIEEGMPKEEADQTEEEMPKVSTDEVNLIEKRMPKEEADQTEEEMPKVSTNEVYLIEEGMPKEEADQTEEEMPKVSTDEAESEEVVLNLPKDEVNLTERDMPKVFTDEANQSEQTIPKIESVQSEEVELKMLNEEADQTTDDIPKEKTDQTEEGLPKVFTDKADKSEQTIPKDESVQSEEVELNMPKEVTNQTTDDDIPKEETDQTEESTEKAKPIVEADKSEEVVLMMPKEKADQTEERMPKEEEAHLAKELMSQQLKEIVPNTDETLNKSMPSAQPKVDQLSEDFKDFEMPKAEIEPEEEPQPNPFMAQETNGQKVSNSPIHGGNVSNSMDEDFFSAEPEFMRISRESSEIGGAKLPPNAIAKNNNNAKEISVEIKDTFEPTITKISEELDNDNVQSKSREFNANAKGHDDAEDDGIKENKIGSAESPKGSNNNINEISGNEEEKTTLPSAAEHDGNLPKNPSQEDVFDDGLTMEIKDTQMPNTLKNTVPKEESGNDAADLFKDESKSLEPDSFNHDNSGPVDAKLSDGFDQKMTNGLSHHDEDVPNNNSSDDGATFELPVNADQISRAETDKTLSNVVPPTNSNMPANVEGISAKIDENLTDNDNIPTNRSAEEELNNNDVMPTETIKAVDDDIPTNSEKTDSEKADKISTFTDNIPTDAAEQVPRSIDELSSMLIKAVDIPTNDEEEMNLDKMSTASPKVVDDMSTNTAGALSVPNKMPTNSVEEKVTHEEIPAIAGLPTESVDDKMSTNAMHEPTVDKVPTYSEEEKATYEEISTIAGLPTESVDDKMSTNAVHEPPMDKVPTYSEEEKATYEEISTIAGLPTERVDDKVSTNAVDEITMDKVPTYSEEEKVTHEEIPTIAGLPTESVDDKMSANSVDETTMDKVPSKTVNETAMDQIQSTKTSVELPTMDADDKVPTNAINKTAANGTMEDEDSELKDKVPTVAVDEKATRVKVPTNAVDNEITTTNKVVEHLPPVNRLFHVRSSEAIENGKIMTKFVPEESSDEEGEVHANDVEPSMDEVWSKIANENGISHNSPAFEEQMPYEIASLEGDKMYTTDDNNMTATKMIKVLCKADRKEWETSKILATTEFDELLREKQCSHIAVENNSFQLKTVNVNRKRPSKIPDYKTIATFEFVRGKTDAKRHRQWKLWRDWSKYGLEMLRQKNTLSTKILFMVKFSNKHLDVMKALKGMLETPGLVALKTNSFKNNDPSTRIALIDQILKQIIDFDFDGVLLDFTGIELSNDYIGKHLENFLGDFLLRNVQEYIRRSSMKKDAKKFIIAVRMDHEDIEHMKSDVFPKLNLMELISLIGVKSKSEEANLIEKIGNNLRVDNKVITNKICDEIPSPSRRSKRDTNFISTGFNNSVNNRLASGNHYFVPGSSNLRNRRSPHGSPKAPKSPSKSLSKSPSKGSPKAPKLSAKSPSKSPPKSPSKSPSKSPTHGALKKAKSAPSKTDSHGTPTKTKSTSSKANGSPKKSKKNGSPTKAPPPSPTKAAKHNKQPKKEMKHHGSPSATAGSPSSPPAKAAKDKKQKHKSVAPPPSPIMSKKMIQSHKSAPAVYNKLTPRHFGHSPVAFGSGTPRPAGVTKSLDNRHHKMPLSPINNVSNGHTAPSQNQPTTENGHYSPLLDAPIIRSAIGLPNSPTKPAADEQNGSPSASLALTPEQHRLSRETLLRAPAGLPFADQDEAAGHVQQAGQLSDEHRALLADSILRTPHGLPFEEQQQQSPQAEDDDDGHHHQQLMEELLRSPKGLPFEDDDDDNQFSTNNNHKTAGYETKLFMKDEC